MTFAVAGQVIGVVITSSPGPTPSATSDRWSAAVPEASASTCSASRKSFIRSSNKAALGPLVSQPERSVSVTAAISSSPIAGGWKPSIVSLLDESFDIDLELNHPLRPGGSRERLLTTVADGQHCAGPVRASAELAEAVAGPSVDPDAADALLGERLLDPGDLTKLARRSDEKANAGAADLRDGREARGGDVLAERRGERNAVQVDTQGDAAELGVVTSAQTGGQLPHAGPLRPDQHLRVGGTVLDADGLRRRGGGLDHSPDLPGLELAGPNMRQRHTERG